MSQIWFTSDTHFGHKNIIKYCNRPFRDVADMDDTIIANINRVVRPGDWLYHLGDWSFGYGYDHPVRYRERIACQNIVLIYGNHDKAIRKMLPEHRRIFREIHELTKIEYRGQQIVLCHYAMRVWEKSHRGVWALYGHSHGTLEDDPNSLSFDVGVDCHGYAPISFDRVKEIMATKTFKAVDHHDS